MESRHWWSCIHRRYVDDTEYTMLAFSNHLLAVLVGMMIAVTYTILYDNNRYIRAVDKHGGRAPPEARLPPAMLGGGLLVIGLAWFAASDGPDTHWIVSIIGSAPFGCGMVSPLFSACAKTANAQCH